jgi:hypothetical protein
MKSAIVLLAAAATVSAHSTWQDLWVGSTDKATSATRVVKDNNPIDSLSSSDMFCGRGPATSAGVAEVAGTYTPDIARSKNQSLTPPSWLFPHRRNARPTRGPQVQQPGHWWKPLRPRVRLHGQGIRRKDGAVRILFQSRRGRLHGHVTSKYELHVRQALTSYTYL